MKIEEVIRQLKYVKKFEDDCLYISDLTIDACDMAIESLEKQVPKKPVKNEYDCVCPVCGFGCLTDEKYCLDCGQALKWE